MQFRPKNQIGQCSPICRLVLPTMLSLIDNNKYGEHMKYSSTYIALEEMIRKNWVTDDISEFNQVLESYEGQGRLTAEEHQALIELYLKNAAGHPGWSL